MSAEGPVKALLIAVTDNPRPVIDCLQRLTPELLCFVLPEPRQPSLDSDIQPHLSTMPRRWDAIAISDPWSFSAAYTTLADRLPPLLRTWDVAAGELAIDITCATPAMAAAMSLIATPYTGRIGIWRGTAGRSEADQQPAEAQRALWEHSNPWDRAAAFVRREAGELFHRGAYVAASQTFRHLEHRVSGGLKPLYRALADLADGYALWDRFFYRQAWDTLKTVGKSLELSAVWGGPSSLQSLVSHVKDNVRFLERLVMDPQPVKQYLGPDLLAHAKRRVDLDRNSEVGVRVLLRALEVYAQTLLYTRYQIKSWDVRIDQLPRALQETCRACYMSDVDGKYHLPLYAQFRTLAGLGDAMGQSFLAQWANMKSLMDAADRAILGTGFEPIKPERFAQLFDMVLKLCRVRETELPRFPVLDL